MAEPRRRSCSLWSRCSVSWRSSVVWVSARSNSSRREDVRLDRLSSSAIGEALGYRDSPGRHARCIFAWRRPRRPPVLLGGTMRHFDLTVSAVYDDDHRPLGVVVTSHDVTDTFLAEERLREESQFRHAIEQSIGAGVVAVDLNGVETYVSDAFA